MSKITELADQITGGIMMGEAKRRGTYTQRKLEALLKQQATQALEPCVSHGRRKGRLRPFVAVVTAMYAADACKKSAKKS